MYPWARSRVWLISHGSRMKATGTRCLFLSMWAALPELVREARFWTPTCNSFPLWAAALLGFLCCAGGCIFGACCAALVLSSALRRAVVSLLRFLVAWLDFAQGGPDLRAHLSRRLGEYRLRE